MSFVIIPPEFLKGISANSDRVPNKEIEHDSDRIPQLYYHTNTLARAFFWRRLKIIHDMIVEHVSNRRICVDFGCGAGVFLPTLSSLFEEVVAVDLYTRDAQMVVDKYKLPNVTLVEGDLYHEQLHIKTADAIVGADVLEHFEKLESPVRLMKKWLGSEGRMFLSLPTENIFTRITRVIGGYGKPPDHYHTAAQVESYLRDKGMTPIMATQLSRVYPLYRISVWKSG
ncbi:MAG: class I SAM-dependent methyltransferase [Nitrospinota bacterium]|nr:class I SAM-dependent methyltransferase [Nitrospinota bacterium]